MAKVTKTLGDFEVTERDLDFVVSSKRHKIDRLVIPRDPRISAAFEASDVRNVEKSVADALAIRRSQKPNRKARRQHLKYLRTEVKKAIGGKAVSLSQVAKGIRETAKQFLKQGREEKVEQEEKPETKEAEVGKEVQ